MIVRLEPITAIVVAVLQACISASSKVALDGWVLYASPDGPDGVGADGGAAACIGGT